MKPPPFEYLAVDSVDAAVGALAEAGGDGKIIAGGQSLLPMLNFRLLRPSVLVDINRVPDLAYVRDDGDRIRIGALTRHYMLQTSELVAAQLPVLHEAMQHVAHLAIRNRGTIGGSLSHADPAAELPMMTLLLDANLDVRSASGRRTIGAQDFFLGALSTALEEDDMVVAIDVPKLPARTGWAFEEVSRRSGDFALACVAVTLSNREDKFGRVRIGMMGVGETPMRASEAEALLEGQPYSDGLVDAAINAIRASVEPNTDLHASSDYRRHLVGILAERAIRKAWTRAMEGSDA
ncbi:MAG: xanthine dehydrogenase family protein subunit M [Proteobacteria bacterium]|nr:xanthine dehydrogenase family protein subunit M [Pseudomonadota bacterium]